MMRLIRFRSLCALTLVLTGTCAAVATPSTHIWAPSTDIQAYKTFHLTSDIYIPSEKPLGVRPGTVTNMGLTVGVFQSGKWAMEAGFDHIEGTYPIYFNAKIGVSENAYGDQSPDFALGAYTLGTRSGGEARQGQTAKAGTDYGVYYAKTAKTFGSVGRISAGYFSGNKKLLVNENGGSSAHGGLFAWERTLGEISDNLSVAVDYMGGRSNFGVLSYGFTWKFTPNVGVIFAFVDQKTKRLTPGDAFTLQVDIDFEVSMKHREKM